MRKVIAKRLSESKFSAPHFLHNDGHRHGRAIDAAKRMNANGAT